MQHPMKRLIRNGLGQPQMGLSFNDIISKLDSSLQQGLDKAKNEAITGALKTIVEIPPFKKPSFSLETMRPFKHWPRSFRQLKQP